jgi:uncharacterized SAM-binding protein YcdF (DUF218 family)
MMMSRLLAALVLFWVFGFVAFAIALPLPSDGGKTDAVIVLTGGEGRIARGIHALDEGWSQRMLVAGVDPEVRAVEFAAEYKVSRKRMKCCVTLDFKSVDTRSNALEASRWIAVGRFKSVRLVTTDWHMRRAAFELERMVPISVVIVRDAVPSQPSLRILFLEYHKLLARELAALWGS